MKVQTLPEGPPVLVFAFANDDRPGRGLSGLRREIEQIRRVLAPAERSGLCEIEVRESTTPAELIEVLEEPRYRRRLALVHFAGHAGDARLLLEGETEPVAAHIRGLAPLLAEHGLALVFLNGCSTRAQAERLVELGIPAVIGTDRPVEDTAAQRFATDFYRSLAAGRPIGAAFRRARAQAECFGDQEGTSRDLTAPAAEPAPLPPPWTLVRSESAPGAEDWSLPGAARDPLFGLPSPAIATLPQEPFMGLRRFTAADAGVFFGRGQAIRNLYLDVTNSSMPPMVVIYGASGVGKSSLLEAGLLPRLVAEHEVHAIRLERGQDPRRALRRSLGGEGSTKSLAELWRVRERAAERPVVVCIDQLEVLVLDEGGRASLARFVRFLEPLLRDEGRPRGKLLLALRKEWFPELRNELRAHHVSWHEHFVEPLDRDDIEEVVLGPTHSATLRSRYGITCEHGLAQRIAGELMQDRESAIAPVLQILLTRMWARTDPLTTSSDGRVRRPFTLETYDALQREGLGLADFVERQLETLGQTHPEATESGLVLDLLYRHTTPRGTAGACTYAELRASYAHRWREVQGLVERCTSLYLLQPFTARSDAEVGVRLAHDTLAPIVRRLYQDSTAPGQAAARLLRARMGMSEASGSRLLGESDLAQIEVARSGMRAWTEEELELVRDSRARTRRRAWWGRVRLGITVGSVAVAVAVLGYQELRSAREAELRTNYAGMRPVSDALSMRREEAGEEAGRPRGAARRGRANAGEDHSAGEGGRMDADRGPDASGSASEGEGGPQRDDAREDASTELGLGPPVPPESLLGADRGSARDEPEPGRAAGRMAAAARDTSRCTIFGLETELSSEPSDLVVSPDGRRVALGLKARQKVFVLEPSEAGHGGPAPTFRTISAKNHVTTLAWDRRGDRLAIGQNAGGLEFVDWRSGGPGDLVPLSGHHEGISALAFSSTRDVLLSADVGGLAVEHRGADLGASEEQDIGWKIYDARASSGPGWIVAGAGEGIASWDPAATTVIPLQSRQPPIRSLDVVSDSVLAVSRWVHICEIDGTSCRTQEHPDRRVAYWVHAVSGGERFVTASSKQAALWGTSLGQPKVIATWPSPDSDIHDLVVVEHGGSAFVFVLDETGTVTWLRVAGDRFAILRTIELRKPGRGRLTVDPNLRYLVAGHQEGKVSLVLLHAPDGPIVPCVPR